MHIHMMLKKTLHWLKKKSFTFKALRDTSVGDSVSYSPELWCQGLEQISNAAPVWEYNFEARGCWTNSMVADWENKPLDSVEGEVGIKENGKNEEH